MAKDPAFLFYANDFDVKTKFFTHEEVGVYIRLLIAQFQFGHLTQEQVLHVTGKDYENVISKFKKDDSGLYYSERLDFEIHKRQAYSESRRKNVSVRYVDSHEHTHVDTHETRMKLHMENENENENRVRIRDKKRIVKEKRRVEFVPPTIEDVIAFFVSKGFTEDSGRKAFEYYATADWVDSKGNKVRNWKQKMIAVWMKDENKSSAGGNGMLSRAGEKTMKNAEAVMEQLKREEQG